MLKRTKRSGKVPSYIRLILVKWRDATHQENEEDAEIGTMLAWTVGFEVYRNEKEVSFCMEVFEDGGKRNITTIPMGMVVGPIRTLARIPISPSP